MSAPPFDAAAAAAAAAAALQSRGTGGEPAPAAAAQVASKLASTTATATAAAQSAEALPGRRGRPRDPPAPAPRRESIFEPLTTNKKLWYAAGLPRRLLDHQYDCLTELANHFAVDGDQDELEGERLRLCEEAQEKKLPGVLIQLPTGAGKTAIAALAPYVLRSKRTLVVTPSLVITDQLVEAFTDREAWFTRVVAPPGDNDRPMSEAVWTNWMRNYIPSDAEVPKNASVDQIKKALGRDLIITNAQRFQEHTNATPELLKDAGIDLVIVDEAHHMPAKTWKNIRAKCSEAKVVYLTATPFHKGKRILTEDDGVRELFTLTRKQAVQRSIIRDVAYDESSEGATTTVDAYKSIARLIRERLREHDDMSKHGHPPSRFHQGIVVTANQAEAERFAEVFNEQVAAKEPWEKAFTYYVVRPDGPSAEAPAGTSPPKRARATSSSAAPAVPAASSSTTAPGPDRIEMESRFQRFKNFGGDKSETFRVIVVVRRLKEGFDHPNITVVGVAKEYKSLATATEFQQFVGRGVRFHRGTDSDATSDPITKAYVVSDSFFNVRGLFNQLIANEGDETHSVVDDEAGDE